LNLRETEGHAPSLIIRNTKEIQTTSASAAKQNVLRVEWKEFI